MIKIYFIILFFFMNTLVFAAHDSKNCDVLETYDFSKFDSWKETVVKNAPEYSLNSDFVANLIKPYSVNKNVIKNDKIGRASCRERV